MTLQDIPILVINLPSRPDRLELIGKELAGLSYIIMPGVPNTNPMVGIAEAHLNCIQKAKASGWPHVLIVEDDLDLRPGAVYYLNEALQNLPDDWDILLGGVYEANEVRPFNTHWNTIGEFCGLHFYILKQKAYEKALQYDGRLHIDRWMNYHGKRMNAFITKKYFAIQRDGYSDNSKSFTNYNDIHLKKAKLL